MKAAATQVLVLIDLSTAAPSFSRQFWALFFLPPSFVGLWLWLGSKRGRGQSAILSSI